MANPAKNLEEKDEIASCLQRKACLKSKVQAQRLFAVQFRVCTKLLNSPWKELFFFRSNTLQNLQRFTFPEFAKPWDGLAFVSLCTFIYTFAHSLSCFQDYQFSNFLNLTFQEFTGRPWEGLALVQFVLLCTPALHQKYFSIAVDTSHWLFIYTTASTPRKLLRDVVCGGTAGVLWVREVSRMVQCWGRP